MGSGIAIRRRLCALSLGVGRAWLGRMAANCDDTMGAALASLSLSKGPDSRPVSSGSDAASSDSRLISSAAAGDTAAIVTALGCGATSVDLALEAAVRNERAAAVECLLRRSTLCTHGGLTPVEAAVHSHPRLHPAVRVAMVRQLIRIRVPDGVRLECPRLPVQYLEQLAWNRYDAAVGHTLLAAACLPEGPELVAHLVRDGHVARLPEVPHDRPGEPATESPPSRRAGNGAAALRSALRASDADARASTPCAIRDALRLSRQVLHACGLRVSEQASKYDGHQGWRDVKTLLCGTVRVQIHPRHLGRYELAAAQLELCRAALSTPDPSRAVASSGSLGAFGWSPERHRLLPPRFRDAARVLLLCAARAESPLSRLPPEATLHIIELLAHAVFWEPG